MSNLPLVIVNPASASSSTRTRWPAMASELRTHYGPFNCIFTEAAGQGRRLAQSAAAEGRRFIIACGGDGTISEIANGILDSGEDAELGILPSGTGGDFRRTLGVPSRTAEAALVLRKGRTLRMDVGRVSFINQEGTEESRHFLGVASFGMSPEVIERVKKGASTRLPVAHALWLSGKLSFAVATLQTTLSQPRTNAFVKLNDQQERRLTVANLCVANGRYFGGGMKIAPNARLNDGQFDVISIGDLGALKILANTPQLYLGTHLNLEQVHHALARRVEARAVSADEEVAIEVDGELGGRLPATFEILPGALKIRCP